MKAENSMNFKDYLQTINQKGLTNRYFGSLTHTGDYESKLQNLSLFSSASLEDIQGLNWSQILATAATVEGANEEAVAEEGAIKEEEVVLNPEENLTGDVKALNDIITELMNVDGIQEYADADGNGEISEDEAMNFVQSLMGKDGDMSSLTYEDIDKAFEEFGIDLEECVNNALEEVLGEDLEEIDEIDDLDDIEEEDEEDIEIPTAPSSSGSSSGGGYGGYGSPRTDNGETAEQIQARIDAKKDQIEDIKSQADADIQAQEESKKRDMKIVGVTEKAYEEYQAKEQAINERIEGVEDSISDKEDEISDYESTIASNENYITSIDEQISANNEVINHLSSDKKDQSDKIATINQKNSNLEAKKASLEQANQENQEKILEKEQEKADLEVKKQEYEAEKQELLQNTLAAAGYTCHVPSDVANTLKNNINQYEDNINEIRAKRDADIQAVKEDITALEVKLKDVQAKGERKSFIRENAAITMQNAVDFGLELDGLTAAEISKKMRAAGYGFYYHAWCGQFQEYIIDQTVGLENTADWYQNCNRASCPAMYEAAKAAGAVVDAKDAQPGDLILCRNPNKNNGRPYHVAMIVSVNADGSFNTIEGNTTDDSGRYTNGVVNQHRRSASSGVVVRVTR